MIAPQNWKPYDIDNHNNNNNNNINDGDEYDIPKHNNNPFLKELHHLYYILMNQLINII